MQQPLSLTANEINCLIYSYFKDSGFHHSAFAIQMEGRLEQSQNWNKFVPRGELVELLTKALLYIEVETHWQNDTVASQCHAPFTLLDKHNCDIKPLPQALDSLTVEPKVNEDESDAKRKAAESMPTNETHKRIKRDVDDMDVDNKHAAENHVQAVDAKKLLQNSGSSSNVAADFSRSDRNAVWSLDQGSTAPVGAISMLSAHTSEIFAAAWNRKNVQYLATGDKDGITYVWDFEGDLKQPRKIAYYSNLTACDLTALDWNPDGTLLAIAALDSIVRVVTLSGKLEFSHSLHDVRENKHHSEWPLDYQSERGAIFAVKFSPSGRWLLTASLDGTAAVYDVAGRKLHCQIPSHSNCCLDVAWLNDDTFVTCGADHMIYVRRVGQSSTIKCLSGHTNEVNQVILNPRKTKLASISDDLTARIWDVVDITAFETSITGPNPKRATSVLCSGHKENLSSAAWCPRVYAGSNELLATVSFDGTSRIWDTATGACIQTFSDHGCPLYTITHSPDGRFMASGGANGWVHIYDVQTRRQVWSWCSKSPKPSVFEIAWQQVDNKNRIAMALECGYVGVIDASRIPALL